VTEGNALAGCSVVTLGGPNTFAGQALTALCDASGARPQVQYRPSMDDVWDALEDGTADCILLTAESTRVGLTDVAGRFLADGRLSALAEVVVPYHCALLGKKGTDLGKVRRVTGHGSLIQCEAYLSRELPGVPTEIHRGNSTAAAAEVAAGDGSEVVVGTLASADHFGLQVLAKDIDGGATGAWWVIGREPTSPDGDTAVVELSLRAGVGGAFPADVIPGGWALRSVLAEPTRDALWSYRLLTVWTGSPESAGWDHPAARLRGLFDSVRVR
jgi:prephenate dehydratase